MSNPLSVSVTSKALREMDHEGTDESNARSAHQLAASIAFRFVQALAIGKCLFLRLWPSFRYQCTRLSSPLRIRGFLGAGKLFGESRK